MKHIGNFLKQYIEQNGIVKAQVAENVGITYNYLSMIFKKPSIDAELLEKICQAVGLHPAVFFDVPAGGKGSYNDIMAQTIIGNAQVHINENQNLRELLAEKERVIEEKERTIQILMAKSGIDITGQNRDNCDK